MPKFSKLLGKLTGKPRQVNSLVNFGKPTFYNLLVSLWIQPIFLVNFQKQNSGLLPPPVGGVNCKLLAVWCVEDRAPWRVDGGKIKPNSISSQAEPVGRGEYSGASGANAATFHRRPIWADGQTHPCTSRYRSPRKPEDL